MSQEVMDRRTGEAEGLAVPQAQGPGGDTEAAGQVAAEEAARLTWGMDTRVLFHTLKMLWFNVKGRWPEDSELRMSIRGRCAAIARLLGQLPTVAAQAFLAHLRAEAKAEPPLARMVNSDKPDSAPSVSGNPVPDDEKGEAAVKWIVRGWQVCLMPLAGMVWERPDGHWYSLSMDGRKEHTRPDCRTPDGDAMVLPGWGE